MVLLHRRDGAGRRLRAGEHVSAHLRPVHHEADRRPVRRDFRGHRGLPDLGRGQRRADGHYHREHPLQKREIQAVDHRRRGSERAGDRGALYPAAAGLGLCRLFCHRVSSLGHDLHHERHRLLGNAPKPEQRPQRAGHAGDADERIHLRRPVRGGGDRAHGGGGKRDSGLPGDGADRRAGVYRVSDFSGSGGSGSAPQGRCGEGDASENVHHLYAERSAGAHRHCLPAVQYRERTADYLRREFLLF